MQSPFNFGSQQQIFAQLLGDPKIMGEVSQATSPTTSMMNTPPPPATANAPNQTPQAPVGTNQTINPYGMGQ